MMSSFPTDAEYNDVNKLKLADIDGSSFRVESGCLLFPCRYTSYPESRALFVMLHDAVDRKNDFLPVFSRWNWTTVLKANILSIDDPTLLMNDRLSLGGYIGTKELNVVPGLLKIAQTVASRLSILYSQIVFFGSRGGGFAAIMAAANSSALCVAIDPLTDIAHQDPEGFNEFVRIFDPAASAEESRAEYRGRWNAVDAMVGHRNAGRSPRLFILQNSVDSSSYRNSYLPFCKDLKIPAEGGIGFHGSVMTATVNHEQSDLAVSPEALYRIISEGIPFLRNIHYSDPGQIDPAEVAKQSFIVEAEGFSFPCRYVPQAGSKLLYVILHAAVDRDRVILPIYARSNWGKILNGSILSIDDPTLYLDDHLTAAWYVGTKERDATLGLVRIAETFASRLGLAPSQIVFYGTSSGGFAAITAAALAGGSCIAINPQTELAAYGNIFDFARVFDPLSSPEQSGASFPTRWSSIEALKAARIAGREPRIVIVQNMLNDEFTVTGHYLPFCREFEIPSDGGVSVDGLSLAMTYSDEGGHDAADTPDVVRRIVLEGIPFILNGQGLHLN